MTLQTDRLFSDFFELMEGRGWIYQLQPKAQDIHLDMFPSPSTQPPKPHTQKQTGKPNQGKLGEKFMASRPFLREAFNVSSCQLLATSDAGTDSESHQPGHLKLSVAAVILQLSDYPVSLASISHQACHAM